MMTLPQHPATIENLFNYSIEVENRAAHLYETMAERFSHVSKLSDFWKGLAKDEIGHARILQEAKNSLTPEQLSALPPRQMWNNLNEIRAKFGRDLLGRVKTLEDAYQLAHDLEYSEVNGIFKFLAGEFFSSGTRKRFIISQIEQHQTKISDFDWTFGDREWREEINIQPI